MAKCKYYKKCKWVTKDAYTCNHESDADGYCGRRRDNEAYVEALRELNGYKR